MLVIGLLSLVLYILQDFILPVTLGGIFAILLLQPTNLINKKIHRHKISSLIVTSICGLLFIIPLAFLLISGSSEVISFIQTQDLSAKINSLTKVIEGYYPSIQQVVPSLTLEQMNQSLSSSTQFVVAKTLSILQGLLIQFPKLMMDLFIILLSAYFFLAEKDKVKSLVTANKVFTKEQTEKIFQSVVMTTNSVVIASLLSGLLQSIIMAIAAMIIAPDRVLLISILTFLFSFVPVIGTSPLTVTLSLVNYFEQDYLSVLVVVGAVGCLTLVDNVLRPFLIGNKIKIHPLLAFLAAIGGLSIFGFYGLFLGPIIVGIFFGLIKDN